MKKYNREQIEAMLMDALDGRLTDVERAELEHQLESYPDLKTDYDLLVGDSMVIKVEPMFPKYAQIEADSLERLNQLVDDQVFWKFSYSNVRQTAFKVFTPLIAMAASVLIFVNVFGEKQQENTNTAAQSISSQQTVNTAINLDDLYSADDFKESVESTEAYQSSALLLHAFDLLAER